MKIKFLYVLYKNLVFFLSKNMTIITCLQSQSFSMRIVSKFSGKEKNTFPNAIERKKLISKTFTNHSDISFIAKKRNTKH